MEHQFPRGRRPWWKAAWFVIVSTILMVLGGCGIRNEAGGGGAGGAAGHAGESVVEPTEPDESVQADEARLDRIGKYESFVGGPASATACTLGSQCPTGNCVDGFCCDSKCDNKCMACSAAKKGSGVDGICGSIAYDTDPDNDCPYGACDGKNQCKNYNGYTCGSAAQCLSNYCVDGYCCGNICMGACQACSAAKKGSGSNGVCGNIAVNTDPDNECNPGECTGSGACNASPQPLAANGAACSSSAQCSSGFCADGVCCDSWCLGTCQACTAAKKGSGTDGTCGNVANDKDPDDECWGGACNGSGVCKQYNGVPCVDKSQCLSGYCVDGFCCGNICTGMCYACSEARKGQGYDGVCGPILSGKDPDNECNPGECGGAGTCNQPQTPQANGTVCASAGQCASGNCIDGVCCDTSCTGLCNACTAAKKGQGADGTCGPILAETDPENECGIGGRCGGNSACKYYNGATCSAGTQCFSNYCVDGVCCGNVCTGSCYACSATKKGQGSDGACGPIANTRDPDNECNPGECNGSGACNQSQVLLANGAACTLATQCSSGFCTDGVCCDKACGSLCEACTATKKGSGTDGTCGSIKYDADPDNECASGSCSGTGTCQFYNGVACTGTGDCLSHYCVDGYCCGNVCNLSCMACSAAKKGSGSNGSCGPIAANTDPDAECGSGKCSGTTGCSMASLGAACTANNQCASGFCADGICCNAACTGLCQACTAVKKGSGSDGTCGNIADGKDPDNECTAGTCTGFGTCLSGTLGRPCAGANDCNGGICTEGVCCDSQCTGTCKSCLAAKKGSGTDGTCGTIGIGLDPDNECIDGACGAGGSCKSDNGIPCANAAACVSGYCVDGVCCASACNGTCQACSAATKGSGVDGVCGFASAGTDPHDTCTLACDGAGACVAAPNGSVCSTGGQCTSGFCVDGYCCNSACSGTCESCAAAAKGAGSNGQCGFVIAGKDVENECAGTCNGAGACAAPNLLADGSACIGGAQCNSGYCIDGVCCNTSCHETCKSCNVPGSVGVCSPHGANACNACGGVVAISTLPGTGPYYGTSEVGDFDNDGVDDVAHYSGGVVTVMVGIGNGMFTKQSETAIGSSSGRIFAGDLNADGALDLVATKGDVLAFTVLMNQGNGSFAPGVDYSASLGYSGSAVIADLNGDGHLDIATSNYGMSGNWPHSVSAFLGNGDGTFAPKIDSVFSGVDPEAIAAADMTGDGIVDLAITTGSISLKYVHILRGVGNGTFVFHDDFPFSNPNGDAYGTRLAIAEFNGDGLLDVAIANDAWTIGEIDVFFNLGGGIFGNPYATTVPMIPQSIKAGDMNGDGKLDIVVAGSDRGDGFSVLTNGGAGSFTPAYFRTSVSATYGSLIDVENDGDLDVVLATQDGFVSLLNPGNAGFEYDGGLDSERTIKPIDLNGDGKLDLVRTGGGIGVQLNQGNNTFGGEVAISTSTSVEIVDVNSDNKPDLIIPNPSSATVSVRLNNGNGTFANATNYATGSSPVHVAAADLTGDGKPDLAVVNNASNSLSILRNNGNGTFAAKVDFPTATTPIKVVAADMNGDNLLDLVVGADGNRNIDVAYNQGNGTFALADFATSGYDGADYLAKDFTGDGKADFAIFDGSIPNFFIAVRVNQGSGTFSAPVNRSIGHMSISANIALELRDMEGDGKLDLWVYWTTMANFGLMSGSMSVLPNFGNGVFGSQNDYPTYNRAVADFNNDGLMDVIRAEASNAMVKYGVCLP